VPVPYSVADEMTRKEFEKKYAGKTDVPIFGDPRIVPTFHGVGPVIFAADPKTGELSDAGKRFAKWLDATRTAVGGHDELRGGHADRRKRRADVSKIPRPLRRVDRRRKPGLFSVDPKKMKAATAAATTRRQLSQP